MSNDKGDLVIEPISSGRKGMIWDQEKDFFAEHTEGSTTRTKDLGEYDGSFFLDSNQTIRPEYRIHRQKFVIIDKDGVEYDQARVDALLKTVKLRFGKNHPLAGQVITECDIADPDDAFLSHSHWEKRMYEGGMSVSEADKMLGPITDIVRGNEDVMSGGLADDAVSGDKRFRMVDESKESDAQEAKVQNSMDAYELFRAMKEDKVRMRSVLTLLGEGEDQDLSIGVMQQTLMQYVSDTGRTGIGMVTRQELFIKFGNMTPLDLKIRMLIRRGIQRGVIDDRGGIYEFRGLALGVSSDDVFSFFEDPSNRHQYEALELSVQDE